MLNENGKPRVICGFPGVGKSTLFRQLSAAGVKILDYDSSTFDKANFPQNYIEHIRDALASGYTILCSTHNDVRKALAAEGISYSIVAPVYEEQKSEYLKRYENRGSPESFVAMMDRNWSKFFHDVWADSGAQLHVGLRPGEVLFDAIASLV